MLNPREIPSWIFALISIYWYLMDPILSALLPIVVSYVKNSVGRDQLLSLGGTAYKMLAERSKEARVQSAAEEGFRSRIQNIKSAEKVYDALIVEQKDLHKLSEYLVREIRRVAEEAVTVHDLTLIDAVFAFYLSGIKKLLSSTPQKPLTYAQLAEIRTELGLIRLKVAWEHSKQAAQTKQQAAESQAAYARLQTKASDEKKLQQRMFVVLALYVLLLIAIIFLATTFHPESGLIPVIGIPISVLLWSSLGSIANMLYRFYKHHDVEDVEQEMRWYSARPLVGMIMGIVIYLVLQAGVIFLSFATSQSSGGQIKDEILWLFSFIGGFSDRFFEVVLDRVKLVAAREEDEKRTLQALLEELKDDIHQTTGKEAPEMTEEAKAGEVKPRANGHVRQELAIVAPDTPSS